MLRDLTHLIRRILRKLRRRKVRPEQSAPRFACEVWADDEDVKHAVNVLRNTRPQEQK